jgi:hypothetical protein
MIDKTVRTARPSLEANPKISSRSACGGLFRRREIWLPTARGWLLGFCLGAAVATTVFFNARRFLAINEPVETKVLVVEGWVPDYALLEGWKEFQKGHYEQLFTVGTPGRNGPNVGPDDTYASWGAERLQHIIGSHPEIIAVPSMERKRDRTYASAAALRDWLKAHGEHPSALNVATMGSHSRRSRMLFQDAFGPKIRVGVISVPNADYDASQWWKSSEGLKEVFTEGVAYGYALLFVHFGSKD